MSPDELTGYLREHIPLSAAMGVEVLRADPGEVVLEAPIDPNLNHRSTAFGGSVSALAILAGWTAVHFRLRAEGLEMHTVIQESAVRYDRPIEGPFRARVAAVEDAAWRRFTKAVRRRGKGRVRLSVTIEAGDETAATFRGTYVALRRGAGSDSGPNHR